MSSQTAELNAPNSPQTLSAVLCSDLLGCPNCKSTNIIKLWRAEIVLPGDNSDNSTKGYRYDLGKLKMGILNHKLNQVRLINAPDPNTRTSRR